MRSLQESLFDKDLVSKDPFDEIIDHLDTKRYSPEGALKALSHLFEWSGVIGRKYNLRNVDKIDDLIIAIRKNDWVMVAKKPRAKMDNYELIWPYHRNNGILEDYVIGWGGRWICDNINTGWDPRSFTGSQKIVHRLGLMGFDECVLITDKKMKDALQKRIKELCVK